jgi:hypothetical protein
MTEESSLFSFFFYVLFVYPATNWILKPGRFSRAKGLTYAISLLVMIAAVKTGLEMRDQGPNHYALLGVPRSASAIEIKRAYKRQSLELHPDKNPGSETALDDFATLKNAYDVLMDMDAREVYNRFGPEKVKSKVVIDEYRVLLEVAIFYAAWGIMTWMLTLGKHNVLARQWVFTGMIAMLVVEVMLLLKELVLPEWFLPGMTEHEFVMLGHNLFPAFLNGCRCIGAYMFVDLEMHTRALLVALHEQNKALLQELSDVKQAVREATRSDGGGLRPQAPMSVGDSMRKLEADLKGQQPIPHPSEQARNIFGPPEKKANYNTYLMIGGYLFFYWLFNHSGKESS